MAVTTDVEIANLALARLGQDAILSLDSATRDSTICNRIFDQNREYCLNIVEVSLATSVSSYGAQPVELIVARMAWLISMKIAGDYALRNQLNTEWILLATETKVGDSMWVQLLTRLASTP